MGGLARRAGYIRAFELRSASEAPALFVDAGNFLSDDKFIAGQLPPEVIAKNRWVVKAYGQFGQAAANLSYDDLPYAAELLKKDGYASRVDDMPFIKRITSANIIPDQAHEAPAPYVIKEIPLKRGKPGTLRIGIIGLTEGKPVSTTEKDAQIAGFTIVDPLQAAKRVLPELKKKADYIIALAYLPQDQANLLATQNPELDLVVGAHQLSLMGDPAHFNRATITYAYTQTKYLGEMRVYLKPDGSIENQANRYVALDDAIPDDPAAADVVAGAHNDFTAEQSKGAQQAAATAPASNLLGAASSAYVGVDQCATCHAREFEIWKRTGHSHAMETLEKRSQQFDANCVKCHVVGYEKGGFQALYSTPQFANVQCESCHGPGRQHVDRPEKGYGFMSTPVGCVQCHTQANSPDFNFETYYPKIKH
ncbi:MAG TPA: multiheme c-type cytochrome [Blastocatellia bacterium]|nr:multiheme c-type cytochrome [Blastocatellia bacterium]